MNQKQKDIIALIKATYFQTEQLKIFSNMIKHAIALSGKNINAEEMTAKSLEHLQNETFLSQFIASFDQLFSHEEIKFLINVYTSETMIKYFKTTTIFSSILSSSQELIQKMVNEQSSIRSTAEPR